MLKKITRFLFKTLVDDIFGLNFFLVSSDSQTDNAF